MREIRTSSSMRGGRKRAFARRACLLLYRVPILRKPFSLRCRCGFGAPASRSTLEHVAVMEQPVEHGADRGDIAEQLAPVFDRTVRREQCTGALIAAHHDLQQILGGGFVAACACRSHR